MATYALIHGGGDSSFHWHLLEPELRDLGHDVVAPDLPCEDESAGLAEYADTVVEAVGDRTELILVAHSLGGFTAPLLADRLPVELIVLVAGMVPSPGESFGEWSTNTGWGEASRKAGVDWSDEIAVFYNDLPREKAEEAMSHARSQADRPVEEPWPLESWPSVPTRYILCLQDRCFPPDWMRGVVRDRLGIEPDEIESGHCAALSRPRELAERLDGYRRDLPDSVRP